MKNFVRIAAVLIAGLIPFLAQAETPAPDVKVALTEWVQAVESKQPEKVVALYDKDSVMLSAFANDPITSKAALLAYYKKVAQEQNISIKVTQQDPRVFGNVAVNTGLYIFHYEQDGEPLDVPARFSYVYVLKDGKWVIISHHSSRVPGSSSR